MKVVLKQDVGGVGKKDSVYEVSDGYARNFLFPRKLAVPADAAAMSEVKAKQEASAHHKAEELAAARALAERLEGTALTIYAKAGQGGRLFGSVTAKDVAQEVTKILGESIDKRKILLEHEVKAFGTYGAEIKLYPQVSAKIKVTVAEQ